MSHPILPRLEAFLRDLRIRWTRREIEHGIQLRCETGDVLSVYRSGTIVLGGRGSRHSETMREFIDANPAPKKPQPPRPNDPERVELSDDAHYHVVAPLEARLRVIAARVGVDSVQAWLDCVFEALANVAEAAEPDPGPVTVSGDDKPAADALAELLRLTGWPVLRREREPGDHPVRWAAESLVKAQ